MMWDLLRGLVLGLAVVFSGCSSLPCPCKAELEEIRDKQDDLERQHLQQNAVMQQMRGHIIQIMNHFNL